MGTFLLRRLLLAIPTLFGVLVVVFALLYIAPGDPVMEMVGERADSATIAQLRKQLHLDEPRPEQFVAYASGVLRGDLGTSFITGRPIARDIAERFPKTLELACAAMLLAVVLGISVGVLTAAYPGGWLDRLTLAFTYLGISFPVYWVGLILILVFAMILRWLPPSGTGGLAFLILPAFALGTRSIAFLARMTRSAMLEVLGSDYIRTARAKGLTRRKVVWKHGLRNSLSALVTIMALDIGGLFGGLIITEKVFSRPGMGTLLIDALSNGDTAVILPWMLVTGALVVFFNLVADVMYGVLDPRVRLS